MMLLLPNFILTSPNHDLPLDHGPTGPPSWPRLQKREAQAPAIRGNGGTYPVYAMHIDGGWSGASFDACSMWVNIFPVCLGVLYLNMGTTFAIVFVRFLTLLLLLLRVCPERCPPTPRILAILSVSQCFSFRILFESAAASFPISL